MPAVSAKKQRGGCMESNSEEPKQLEELLLRVIDILEDVLTELETLTERHEKACQKEKHGHADNR